MKLRTIAIIGVSAMSGLYLASAVVSPTSAQTPVKPAQNADVQLRLSLRTEKSGEPRLFLDMPVNETSLRWLMSAEQKKPAVFLSADKGIPYAEVVKVIDMLGTLGLQKISLDTKHYEAGRGPSP